MTIKSTILTISMLASVFVKVLPQNTHADWSKHLVSSENSAFNNIIRDGQTVIANGYWILNGEFNGIVLPNSLSSNALLVKMDLEGNIIWQTTMTGEGYETFFDLALDSQKNIVAVGWSSSSEPISINGEVVYVPDMEWTSRGVVAKFSGIDGSLIWYKPVLPHEEYYNMSINKLTIDSADNIYVGGYSNTGFEIDGTEFPYTQEGWGSLTFVAKLNLDGQLLWGKQFNFVTEGEAGWSMPRSLVIRNENLYLAYQYSKPVIVGDTILPYEGEGNCDWIALIKMSAQNSDVVAVSAFGSSSDQNITSMKIDNEGNLLSTGFFTSFSGFHIGGIETISYGLEDAWVAKFDENLNILWLKSMGSEFASRGFNLSISNNNRIFVGGGFDSFTPFYFEGHKVIDSQNPNSLGMFQVILDEEGIFEKAFALYGDGIESILEYSDAVVLENDQVIVVGASIGNVQFIEGNTFFSAHNNGFFMKWDLSENYSKVFFEIRDEDENLLENATITFGTITNIQNNYTFYMIEPGTYSFSVELAGYNTFEGELSVMEQTENILITMTQTDAAVKILENNKINVFPNPSVSQFTIDSKVEIVQIRILDATGKTILSQNVNTNSVKCSTEAIPAGFYFVFAETKSGIITRKIQFVK